MVTTTEVIEVWARGDKCFSPQHQAPAKFIVNGGTLTIPTCGDHLSVAVREAASNSDPPKMHVTVWWKP